MSFPCWSPSPRTRSIARFLKVVQWRLQRTRVAESLAAPSGAYCPVRSWQVTWRSSGTASGQNKGGPIFEGDLQGWLWQTEVFGLHFARLDIRQESGRNLAVVAELMRGLGLSQDYASLSEESRRELFHRALSADAAPPRRS